MWWDQVLSGAHDGRQMFFLVDFLTDLLWWEAPLLTFSSFICSMSSHCTGTWLRWNRGGSTYWSHSDNQVSESIQNKRSIQFQSSTKKQCTLPSVSCPFYNYFCNNFLSWESYLYWKHKIITDKSPANGAPLIFRCQQ